MSDKKGPNVIGCFFTIVIITIVALLICNYIKGINNFTRLYKTVENCHSFKIVYDVDTKVMYTYSYAFIIPASMSPILNPDGTPKLYIE